MRSLLISSTFLAVLGTSLYGAEANEREKRFIWPEHRIPLTDGLSRISDQAREFGKTLEGIITEATQRRRADSLESIFGDRWPLKPANSRAKPSSQHHHETETEEEEPPHEEEDPHKITDEMPAFHPLIIPFSFPFGLLSPWWKGPNVCTERTEVDDAGKGVKTPFGISIQSTQCFPGETTYVCTKKIRNEEVSKTITTKYQCCHGYAKKKNGSPGCEKVNMFDLLQTVKDLEATEFADMLEQTTLAEKLSSENFTIFVPSNDALADYQEDNEINGIADKQSTRKRNKGHSDLTTGHVVEGFVNVDLSENDHVLNSLNGKTTVRINKYGRSRSVITANCVPIVSKDNFAVNGVVHLISDIMPQPRKSILDIVKASPEYSIFNKLLMESTLKDELKNSEKSWTLFVPNDDAFKKMDKSMMLKIMSGEGCSESILRNHVLQGTVCKQAIENIVTIQNYLGKSMTLSVAENEKFKVNNVDVNMTNVLGTNGVVHFIGEVLIPAEAYSFLEYLEKTDRKDLLDLISAAELTSQFQNLNNATFFAPSKDALKRIPNDTFQEWMSEPHKLNEILKYHLASPKTLVSGFSSNKELTSLDNGLDIRIKLYEMFPGIALAATAQCSLMVKHDNAVCGGVIHTIDKVMVPPKNSVLEALKGMKDHDILLKLLADTEIETKLSKATKGPFTLLAPVDSAFQRFDEATLDELLANKTRAEQILKMHIIPEAMCCRGVHQNFPFSHQYVRTMEGNLLSLHRSGHLDRVRFGPARAIQCDITAKNGIIHSVNRVILPNKRPSINPLWDLGLFSIF